MTDKIQRYALIENDGDYIISFESSKYTLSDIVELLNCYHKRITNQNKAMEAKDKKISLYKNNSQAVFQQSKNLQITIKAQAKEIDELKSNLETASSTLCNVKKQIDSAQKIFKELTK